MNDQRTSAPRDVVGTAALTAVVGRLIPNDHLGPGALEAGAAEYIQSALSGALASALPVYQAGLQGLQTAAAREHGAEFENLTADVQDALLARIETGDLGPDYGIPADFFDTIREHTIEGFLGDPVHGGNRGEIGWKLINYPRLGRAYSAEEQGMTT